MIKSANILDQKILERINAIYSDCVTVAINGNSSDVTELELEILINMIYELNHVIDTKGPIKDEIVDAWLTVLIHQIVMRMSQQKSDSTFDKVANDLFLRIFA